MCLHQVTNTTESSNAHGVGFKVMLRPRYEGKPSGVWHGEMRFTPPLHEGREYQAQASKHSLTVLHQTADYPLGFHIFKTKRAAELWRLQKHNHDHHRTVVKVKWRHKLAEGIYGIRGSVYSPPKEEQAIVAKFMTIIGECSVQPVIADPPHPNSSRDRRICLVQ